MTTTTLLQGQCLHETHPPIALESTTSEGGHSRFETHHPLAPLGENSGQPATPDTTPSAPPLVNPVLALAADVLDDLERVRIANENRFRTMIRGGVDDPRLKETKKDGTPKYSTPADLPPDKDGEIRGLGLDARHSDVYHLGLLVQLLKQTEHDATLNLQRTLRRNPLYPWVKAQKGIGEKTAARLLAVIGDPYINMTTGKPRTVSQLWSYCGHGDPSRKPRKGMSQADLFAMGNPLAKKRVWLIASKCLMAQGPYAQTYYERKDATEGREHFTECKRCGPSGHPAQPGSLWSDGHRHADALRITGKAILRDLWVESKRLHEAI